MQNVTVMLSKLIKDGWEIIIHGDGTRSDLFDDNGFSLYNSKLGKSRIFCDFGHFVQDLESGSIDFGDGVEYRAQVVKTPIKVLVEMLDDGCKIGNVDEIYQGEVNFKIGDDSFVIYSEEENCVQVFQDWEHFAKSCKNGGIFLGKGAKYNIK